MREFHYWLAGAVIFFLLVPLALKVLIGFIAGIHLNWLESLGIVSIFITIKAGIDAYKFEPDETDPE